MKISMWIRPVLLTILGWALTIPGLWGTNFVGHLCYCAWGGGDWAWWYLPELVTVFTTLGAGICLLYWGIKDGHEAYRKRD